MVLGRCGSVRVYVLDVVGRYWMLWGGEFGVEFNLLTPGGQMLIDCGRGKNGIFKYDYNARKRHG